MSTPPTIETYPELQRAFNYFNEQLFDNKLSSPLFILESNVRFAGHFTKDKFTSADGKRKTHQIALNPARFHKASVKENLSTLVREMCHQYQVEHGQESRRFYHDKQWADYMQERGLIPSDTGLPGGKRTGQTMKHYIEVGGRFDVLASQLIKDGFSFAWHDADTMARHRQNEKQRENITKQRQILSSAANASTTSASSIATLKFTKGGSAANLLVSHSEGELPYNSSNRVKFICIVCSQQCWGKRGLKLLCGNQDCGQRPLEAEDEY